MEVKSEQWYKCDINMYNDDIIVHKHAFPYVKTEEIFKDRGAGEVFFRRARFFTLSGYPSFLREKVANKR